MDVKREGEHGFTCRENLWVINKELITGRGNEWVRRDVVRGDLLPYALLKP